MKKLRRAVLWITLILVIALCVLSICGAFLGTQNHRSKNFFNSPPVAAYWIALTVTLIAGCILFKRLVRVPALFLIHAGCVAILIGGLWGSDAGKAFQRARLGRLLIPNGHMMILTGQTENRVYLDDVDKTGELPFSLTLDQFRIEYYDPGTLYVRTTNGARQWTIPAKPGTVRDLGPPFGVLQVVNTFKNFRIDLDEGRAFDTPGPGSNPAAEILITAPGGQPQRQYIFERHPGHMNPAAPLHIQYQRDIRDYISDIRVTWDKQVVTRKSIEVNHPLYYGGYHFYQSSYGQDPDTGKMYTVLSVTNDTGLRWVFAGYGLLCLGVAWQCWFHRVKPRKPTGER